VRRTSSLDSSPPGKNPPRAASSYFENTPWVLNAHLLVCRAGPFQNCVHPASCAMPVPSCKLLSKVHRVSANRFCYWLSSSRLGCDLETGTSLAIHCVMLMPMEIPLDKPKNMETNFSQSNPPVLLFLEEKSDATSPFADEFSKLAPHWVVVRVHDRLSAMRYLDSAPVPQAFVIDLAVLDQNGLELIEWIKTEHHLRFLPIAVLSNSDDPSHRHRCVALGISSYLDKPKTHRELRNNIRYIVKICEGSRFHSRELREMACV
jgi:CheY-like chemotaxis protein